MHNCNSILVIDDYLYNPRHFLGLYSLVSGHKEQQWKVGFWRVRKRQDKCGKRGRRKKGKHMKEWQDEALTWLSAGSRGMEAALPWPSIGRKCSVSENPSRPISLISTVCWNRGRPCVTAQGQQARAECQGPQRRAEAQWVEGENLRIPLSLHTVRRCMSRRTVLPQHAFCVSICKNNWCC